MESGSQFEQSCYASIHLNVALAGLRKARDKGKPPQEFQFATTLDGAIQAVPDRKAGDLDQISFREKGRGAL